MYNKMFHYYTLTITVCLIALDTVEILNNFAIQSARACMLEGPNLPAELPGYSLAIAPFTLEFLLRIQSTSGRKPNSNPPIDVG